MTRRSRNKSRLGTVECLKLFERRVGELQGMRSVQSGLQTQFKISWDAESKLLRSQSTEPDEEDLRSFLLLFRHFISESEPIFVKRIFNDCLRFLDHDVLKGKVEEARDVWRKEIAGTMCKVVVDGVDLTPEYVLNLWINGYYFHNDPDKALELERLLKLPIPVARMQFLGVLPSLTQVLLYLGYVVTYGFEKNLFQIPHGLG